MLEEEKDSDKENAATEDPPNNAKSNKTIPKPSRIPIFSGTRPPLTTVKHQAQNVLADSTNSAKPTSSQSQVRAVPDFGKLHKKFQHRLEKTKQKNRIPTQVQAFALTPVNKFSAKKCRERSKREENSQPCTPLGRSRNKVNLGGQLGAKGKEGGKAEEVDSSNPDSPFKVNPTSLRAILSEQPDDTGDSNRLTVAAPGRSGIRSTLTLPSDITPRYSMYSRHSFMKTQCHETKQKSVIDQFKELCERKVQTTIQSTRRLARVDEEVACGKGGMADIKLSLDAQLSLVADPPTVTAVETPHITKTTSAFSPITAHTTPSCTCPVVVLTTTPHITQTHRDLKLQKSIPFTAGVKLLADLKQMIPTIGRFYDVDKEVCGILEGCRKPHGASRPLCRNPILWTLQFPDDINFLPLQCHFTPIRDK